MSQYDYSGVPTEPRAMRRSPSYGPYTYDGLNPTSPGNMPGAYTLTNGAVTGPATVQQATHRSSEVYLPREVTHSNSSKWVSDVAAVRSESSRLRDRARLNGLASSPFFPQTDAEYIQHKAEMLAAKAAALRRRIAERTRAEKRASLLTEHEHATEHQPALASAISRPKDGLSTVLGMRSCFNRRDNSVPVHDRVHWPSVSDLKVHSAASRKHGWGPSFPPPRINRACSATSNPELDPSLAPQQHIPYEQCQIIFERWDWLSEAEKYIVQMQDQGQRAALAWNEINPTTAGFIKEIARQDTL